MLLPDQVIVFGVGPGLGRALGARNHARIVDLVNGWITHPRQTIEEVADGVASRARSSPDQAEERIAAFGTAWGHARAGAST